MVQRSLRCLGIALTSAGLFVSPVASQVAGVLIWEFDTSEGVYTSIGVPDVDGDGHPDVVAAIYYINPGADLYCVSGATGSLIWESSDCLGTWGNKALASVGDLNGDDVGDVILGTPGGVYPGTSVITKDGATGGTIWYNDAPTGWVYSVACMPDVNGDSVPDVIAGAGGSPPAAFLFDGSSGSILWSFELEYGGACWNVAPIGDVNSSGVDDVIVGAEGSIPFDRAGLFCVEGANGDTIWSVIVGDNLMDVSAFNDLTGDGIEEVIAGGWMDSVYCFGGADGKLVWGRNIGHYVQEITPIDDVNGDTLDDILVGSWLSSIYCLDGITGDVLWSTPVGGDCWSVASVTDISGDGIADAVAGAVNGRRVLCVSGADGSPIWDYQSGERVYDVSSIDDVNGDGLPDVLVGLQDQENALYHLLCFDGDADLPVAERDSSELLTLNPQLIEVYPNPFTTSTTITYSVQGSRGAGVQRGERGESQIADRTSYITLSVYDLSGRLVRTLADKPSNYAAIQVSNQVVWDGAADDGRRAPAGIYFCRIEYGGSAACGKVTLVR